MRRSRTFWCSLVGASLVVGAVFLVTPALAMFTVTSQPTKDQTWTTPTLGAPSNLTCEWPITADPTSVTLNWTNAQSWSQTNIWKNVNGGTTTTIASAANAGVTSMNATSLSAPSSNTYGFYGQAVKGNWTSAMSSAATSNACKLGVNEAVEGAVNAKLNGPSDVAFDSSGNLYIADTTNHRIRKVDRTTNVITTVAGTGSSGTTGDGTASARVTSPRGIFVDQYDNVLIADTGNSAVRMVKSASSPTTLYGKSGMSTAGAVYTITGSLGNANFAGDGGASNDASVRLNAPSDIAVDTNGNLFIADSSAHRIRCVAATSLCGTTNTINTFAGNGTSGYVSDNVGATTVNARINAPSSIAITAGGSVVWSDRNNNRIRMVYVAGETYTGSSLTYGNIYTIASGFNSPWGIAIDSAGNVLFGDSGNSYIKVFWATSPSTRYLIPSPTQYTTSTIGGNGSGAYNGTGVPISGAINGIVGTPYGLAIDPLSATDVYVADNGKNIVRRFDYANNVVYTWAGISGTSTYVADSVPAHGWEYDTLYHNAVDSSGNVYFADYAGHTVRKYMPSCNCVHTVAGTGNGTSTGDGASALLATINGPSGVYVNSTNDVFIAETGGHKIRMVAGSTATKYGQSMTQGYIYTIAGNGAQCSGVQSPCGDGTTAATSSRLNGPRDIVVDASGNLFISDTGNCEIRFVANSTAAAYGLNGGGALTAQRIYNLAGTQLTCTSTASTLKVPDGITLDGSGNLYITESTGVLIRKVSTTGVLSTWAGTGTICTTFTDSTLLASTFCFPKDITYNSSTGAFYIADSGNSLIRKVTGSNVTTIGGGGSTNPGDGGPARGAQMSSPIGVAIHPGGNLYVTLTAQYADIRVIKGPDP